MKTITIIGNIGANAVRRNTSDGRELMTFSVAVNDRSNNTTWFNCVGALRDKQFDFLVKGQQVAVTGDLAVGVYNNRPDLTVNIDRIELCGGKREEGDHSQDSEDMHTGNNEVGKQEQSHVDIF